MIIIIICLRGVTCQSVTCDPQISSKATKEGSYGNHGFPYLDVHGFTIQIITIICRI